MAIYPIPPSREEWLKLREPFLGASTVCALLGVQAEFHDSPYTLWAQKSGKEKRKEVTNIRTRSGQLAEEWVAQFTAEERGWTLCPGVFAVDDVAERFAATLDRVILPSPEDEAAGFVGPGALECKYVEWSPDITEKWEGDEPPPYYLIQLQAQLACSGYSWGAVGARVGSKHIIRPYLRHEGIIAEIREAVNAFWDAVAFGAEPKVDRYESTTKTLKAIYTKQKDTVLDLRGDNELPDLCIQAKKLAKVRTDAEKAEEKIKNEIRAKIGENEKALIAGGISVTRSVGEDIPPRPAEPDEEIPGRKGADKLTIKVPKEMLV